jgi:hypothetical protein
MRRDGNKPSDHVSEVNDGSDVTDLRISHEQEHRRGRVALDELVTDLITES